MNVVFHPDVYSDIAQVMAYYERVAGLELADDFYAEFLYWVHKASERPEIYHRRDPNLGSQRG